MASMNVREFVAAIGGTANAARAFGVGRTAVANWRTWNRLPARLHLRASRLAKALGIPFDPDPETNHDLSIRRKTAMAERASPGSKRRDAVV